MTVIVARAAALVALLVLVVPAQARALDCGSATMEQRIDGADAVFAGTLTDVRQAADGGYRYRFDVGQVVKGPVGAQIEVSAGERLVDATDKAVEPGVDAGVLAHRDGAELVVGSCDLTDPGALLTAADEPRGGWIKVVLGAAILTGVLLFSRRRLRRRAPRV